MPPVPAAEPMHRQPNRQDVQLHPTRRTLVRARADWRNGVGVDTYRHYRPMVERTLAWIVANGHRRVRYRGVERNRLGLSLRATAINLRRLINLGLHHGPNGWAITTT